MNSLQDSLRSSQNTFDRFVVENGTPANALHWICSIASQLGDAFMVFARWQCLGLGGRYWQEVAKGQLFDPGLDEWLNYFHPDDQGLVAMGLADPTVNTFPDVRILNPARQTYQHVSMRLFYPPFDSDGHLFAIVFQQLATEASGLSEAASFNQAEHMLSSSTAEVIEIVRETGRVVHASLYFEEANLLTENEASGQDWIQLGLMQDAYARMLMGKIRHHAELRNYPAVLQRRDGRDREMLIDILPSLDDEDNVVMTFKDVTTHNHACRHLHEVIDHLPFGVFTRGLDTGKYQLSNTKANALLNEGKPLRGLEDEDLFEENDVARILSNLNVNPETGLLNSEEPVYLCEGKLKLDCLPMADSRGRFSRIVGVIQKVDRAAKGSANPLGLDAASLANVGHEFRTPMNAILGFTSLLADTSLQAEQKEMLETVRASSEALSHTVDLMLELAALNNSQKAVETDVLNIEALLEDLAEDFCAKASRRGLVLSVEVDPQLPSAVEGDAGKLRQILENLIENAIKFTPEGEVGIQADLIEQKAEHALVQFSVFDSGIGISEEKQQLIFQAYRQEDESETRPYEGTGLGLTVSDRLAQLMGSRILLQSAPGEGSIFSFQIKLKVTDGVKLIDERPCPVDLTVVIFSNLPEQAQVFSRTLSVWGAKTVETTSLEVFSREILASSGRTVGLCSLQGASTLPEGETQLLADLQASGKVVFTATHQEEASALVLLKGFAPIVPTHARMSAIERALIEQADACVPSTASVMSEEEDFSNLTILVIDDRSLERREMVSLLLSWGVKVDLCETERNAIELVSSKNYDVIFFEANYLGADTAAMVEGLRLRMDETASTTFVGLAHPAMKSAERTLSAAKVRHFMSKPVDREQLRSFLAQLG